MLDGAIPGRLSPIGVDDTRFADLFDPPVSVISRDMVEIGARAARLVLERITDIGLDIRRTSGVGAFALRSSTAPPQGVPARDVALTGADTPRAQPRLGRDPIRLAAPTPADL